MLSDIGTFNLAEEAKEPEFELVPNGTYTGVVVGVKIDDEKFSINWDILLQDNGGVTANGKPIDGLHVFPKNWLPKPGDEHFVDPATGEAKNKRQTKIDSLAFFAKKMKIDMNTPQSIVDAVSNGLWLGIKVRVTVATREYDDKVYSDVKKIQAI